MWAALQNTGHKPEADTGEGHGGPVHPPPLPPPLFCPEGKNSSRHSLWLLGHIKTDVNYSLSCGKYVVAYRLA